MNDGSRAVEIFLRYLKVEGCKVVFGIPGGLLFPFFEAVEQDEDLSLVVTRHEEGAAFMADGYARTGGKLAVCAATSGPGATNLITGVACAFADGVPMLVVTGQAATRGIGKGAAQETGREDIDIVAMFRPITKYSAMVSDATCLARHLRRALRLAFSGRPGPVHLNVPVEVWERSVEESWLHPPSYRPSAQVFDPLATARAADALLAASHPVILAGSGVGVARAEALLARIANLLPARVATTPRGKGLFPEDHPLSLGVLGFGGHRDARAAVLENPCVDVLFTMGASLNETTAFNWDARLARGKTLIQLDIDPDRVGRNYAVDVALVGDAEATLSALADTLEARVSTSRSEWGNAPPLIRGHARYMDEAARIARSEPLTPQRWRAELQQVLPPDALLFSDISASSGRAYASSSRRSLLQDRCA